MTISGSTQSASNAIILGGAGRDTITITGGAAANAGQVASIGGGDGGDLITTAQVSTLQLALELV